MRVKSNAEENEKGKIWRLNNLYFEQKMANNEIKEEINISTQFEMKTYL